MALAGRVVAAVAAMRFAVVGQLDARRRKRRVEPAQHFGCDRTGFLSVHCPYIEGFEQEEVATKQSRMHGRVEGARAHCAVPGCAAPGEFKAPLAAGQFRRAGQLALPVPRPCPRAQCQVQFLRRHEPRGDQRGASRRSPAGTGRAASSPPTAPTRRRRGAISPTRSTRSRRASGSIRDRSAVALQQAPSGARCRCWGSARTPTATRCASAIRSWCGAITPTRTAATARTRRGSRAVIEAYQLLRKSRGLRLIAVGRAEREIGAVGPAPRRPRGRRRMGEQPRAIGLRACGRLGRRSPRPSRRRKATARRRSRPA